MAASCQHLSVSLGSEMKILLDDVGRDSGIKPKIQTHTHTQHTFKL